MGVTLSGVGACSVCNRLVSGERIRFTIEARSDGLPCAVCDRPVPDTFFKMQLTHVDPKHLDDLGLTHRGQSGGGLPCSAVMALCSEGCAEALLQRMRSKQNEPAHQAARARASSRGPSTLH